MKTLLLDIETRPMSVYAWGLWDQNIGLNQIAEDCEMICFGAMWLDSDRVMFASVHHDGKEAMLALAHRLLDEADVVLTYNGRRFDIPHLNREFIEAGMAPPSTYQQIDLFQVVKRRFKFPSYKLAYVLHALGLEGKAEHEGFDLWVKCMAGDDAAWRRMRRYCKQDVKVLKPLYGRLQAWIPNHPNRALYDGVGACPTCGTEGEMVRWGFAYTKGSKFQRWRAGCCGAWFRSTKRIVGSELTEVVL